MVGQKGGGAKGSGDEIRAATVRGYQQEMKEWITRRRILGEELLVFKVAKYWINSERVA